jgi:hypothetical protein
MTHTPARSTPAWCQSSQLLSIAIYLYDAFPINRSE